MNLKTRLSAIALTVCMTLSAIPAAAFAEETTTGTVARINKKLLKKGGPSQKAAVKQRRIIIICRKDIGKDLGQCLFCRRAAGFRPQYCTGL